jgi:hypothetical protein
MIPFLIYSYLLIGLGWGLYTMFASFYMLRITIWRAWFKCILAMFIYPIVLWCYCFPDGKFYFFVHKLTDKLRIKEIL